VSTSVIAETVQTAVRCDPTLRFRRVAGAIVLPLGILLQVATNTLYALLTMNGGSDATGDAALALFSSAPSAWRLVALLSMAGSLLIVAGLPAALRVLRQARPRLSLVAGILMMTGYVAYFGIVAGTGLEIALATRNIDAGAAIDASQDGLLSLPLMILFVVGNILGTFLLGLAVILGRQLPWTAGALIMAWPICHITGLIVGTEWFAVAGGTLETIGLVLLTAVALRTPDAEWASRG